MDALLDMPPGSGDFPVLRDIAGDRPPRRRSRVEKLETQIACLKERMNIAVIHGGDKEEPGAVMYRIPNTRPWKSYQSVAEQIAESLRTLGFRSVHVLAENMHLSEELQARKIHLAWLNTGGVQGFNPVAHAPSMLELMGVPYVGHNPLIASILDNKPVFKLEVTKLGLNTATFTTWHPSQGRFDPAHHHGFQRAFRGHVGPYVVKPVSGRASLHVHVVDDASALADCLQEVFDATQNHVMIEDFLPGREFCIAIAGSVTAHSRSLSLGARPFIFSPVERVLADDERIFTSMDVRPISTDRMRLLSLETEGELISRLEKIAMTVFSELGLETLIRLDLRMCENGEIHILEANPKPDLKRPEGNKTSIVSVGLERCGMDYDDLILSLIADRVDLLFSKRRGAPDHLHALIQQ